MDPIFFCIQTVDVLIYSTVFQIQFCCVQWNWCSYNYLMCIVTMLIVLWFSNISIKSISSPVVVPMFTSWPLFFNCCTSNSYGLICIMHRIVMQICEMLQSHWCYNSSCSSYKFSLQMWSDVFAVLVNMNVCYHLLWEAYNKGWNHDAIAQTTYQ